MNLMKVNKRKCKVLPPGRNFPVHQDRLRAYSLESSLTEEDLKVLVGRMLNISQPCSKEVRGLSQAYWPGPFYTGSNPFAPLLFISALFFCLCPFLYILLHQFTQCHPSSNILDIFFASLSKSQFGCSFLVAHQLLWLLIFYFCLHHVCLSNLCLFVLLIAFNFSLVYHLTRSSTR